MAKDLFEYPNKQPKKLKKLLKAWEEKSIDGMEYADCEQLLKECEAIGYTFDYGLDAIPFDLHKMAKKGK